MRILLQQPTLSREGLYVNLLLHLGWSPELILAVLLLTSAFQALQTIALFGLRLNRFPAAVGALIFFLLFVSILRLSTLISILFTLAHLFPLSLIVPNGHAVCSCLPLGTKIANCPI